MSDTYPRLVRQLQSNRSEADTYPRLVRRLQFNRPQTDGFPTLIRGLSDNSSLIYFRSMFVRHLTDVVRQLQCNRLQADVCPTLIRCWSDNYRLTDFRPTLVLCLLNACPMLVRRRLVRPEKFRVWLPWKYLPLEANESNSGNVGIANIILVFF